MGLKQKRQAYKIYIFNNKNWLNSNYIKTKQK